MGFSASTRADSRACSPANPSGFGSACRSALDAMSCRPEPRGVGGDDAGNGLVSSGFRRHTVWRCAPPPSTSWVAQSSRHFRQKRVCDGRGRSSAGDGVEVVAGVGRPSPPGVSSSLSAYGIKAAPAAILRGLDLIGGAVLGGIIIGLLENIAAIYRQRISALGQSVARRSRRSMC